MRGQQPKTPMKASSFRPLVALLITSLIAVGLPFLAGSAEPKAKAAKSAQPNPPADKGKDNDKNKGKGKGKDKGNEKEKGKEIKGKASDLATSPKSEKKKEEKQKPPAKGTGNLTILREAYNTLALGNHVYDGHRKAAMHQVDKAAHVLDSDFKGDGNGGLPRPLSDAQLLGVKLILEKARPAFTGAALEHVDLAIKELATALSLPRKR